MVCAEIREEGRTIAPIFEYDKFFRFTSPAKKWCNLTPNAAAALPGDISFTPPLHLVQPFLSVFALLCGLRLEG
jgi:hypothetical protein